MSTPNPQPSPMEGEYFDAPENHDNATAQRTAETLQTAPPTLQPSSRQNTADLASINQVETSPQQPSRSARRARSSSIRIRRLPSSNRINGGGAAAPAIPEIQVVDPEPPRSAGVVRQDYGADESTGRKRSFSAPERRDGVLAAIAAEQGGSSARQSAALGQINEGERTNFEGTGSPSRNASVRSSQANRPGMFGRLRSGYTSGARRQRANSVTLSDSGDHEYDDEVANLLDVVDPEVSTLSTLTNVQNSLFIPDLSIGRFNLINRRPVYEVSRHDSDQGYGTDTTDELMTEAQAVAAAEGKKGALPSEDITEPESVAIKRESTLERRGSITSQLSESHYAVLPHGVDLSGWTKEDRDSLNDHVRHMLHSRRSKFKRGMKGFGKYVRRPLGFFVTLYAFCITVFGLIWVLFLIGWISGGSDSRHKYLINVIDNVLVALFAIMGDGLAPFRAVDTYHMCFIAHYATLTWRRRREREMSKLENRNDLPTATDYDVESGEKAVHETSVLSPKQQKRLEHHQKKFARSHTYYKPHETTTHYAFSIRLLITITVLLDCHSLLQIALGSVTWGWDWHTRPAVITTVILCCSITVNIVAGILISVGDKRSRKTEVVEQMFRQQLTQEAIKKVERHKREKKQKETAEKERLANEDRKAYEGT